MIARTPNGRILGEHGPWCNPTSGTLTRRLLQARGFTSRYEHDRQQRLASIEIGRMAGRWSR